MARTGEFGHQVRTCVCAENESLRPSGQDEDPRNSRVLNSHLSATGGGARAVGSGATERLERGRTVSGQQMVLEVTSFANAGVGL